MTNINIGATPLAMVQNGTDIINSNVSAYIERYRMFAKQTAASFLGLAETLVEAKSKLSPVDFSIFCKNISLEKDGSTYKKIMKIGTEISRFQPVLDLLPNSWTTIYDLAKLDNDKFVEITQTNVLSPTMTAIELKKALNQDKKSLERKKEEVDITIKMNSLTVEEKIKVYEFIFNIKNDYPFEVLVNNKLTTELENFKIQKAA